MNTWKILVAILITIFISGCATSYKSKNWRGHGFTEKKLSSHGYIVTFEGNYYTSRTEVEEMALKRCAELTQKEGYTYFLVLKEKADRERYYEYKEHFEKLNEEEEHTITMQIFMAEKEDLSKEEFRRAINANIFLKENKF